MRRRLVGKFDQRVTLKSPDYSSPADEIIGWTTVATVWAKIHTQSGEKDMTSNPERFEAMREIAHQWLTVEINRRSDVTQTWRLTYRSTDYDVRSAEPLTRDGTTILTCRSVL